MFLCLYWYHYQRKFPISQIAHADAALSSSVAYVLLYQGAWDYI